MAIALGINVWVSVVLLPTLFVGALSDSGMMAAVLLPLPILGLGLWRRSDTVLLLAFPSALLLPVAIAPDIASVEVYGAMRFAFVACGLVAYTFGASFFTSFYEPAPPVNVRPLASSRVPVPERWRRRFRMYRWLTVMSVVFPLVLLYTVNFNDSNREFLRQMFPGRVAAMTTLLNLLVIGAWLVLYGWVFLGVLKPHRTGDRALASSLARLHASARRGRPRPVFYLGVVVALTLMLLLVISRGW